MPHCHTGQQRNKESAGLPEATQVVSGRAHGLHASLPASALRLARDSCAHLPNPEQDPEGQL